MSKLIDRFIKQWVAVLITFCSFDNVRESPKQSIQTSCNWDAFVITVSYERFSAIIVETWFTISHAMILSSKIINLDLFQHRRRSSRQRKKITIHSAIQTRTLTVFEKVFLVISRSVEISMRRRFMIRHIESRRTDVVEFAKILDEVSWAKSKYMNETSCDMRIRWIVLKVHWDHLYTLIVYIFKHSHHVENSSEGWKKRINDSLNWSTRTANLASARALWRLASAFFDTDSTRRSPAVMNTVVESNSVMLRTSCGMSG